MAEHRPSEMLWLLTFYPPDSAEEPMAVSRDVEYLKTLPDDAAKLKWIGMENPAGWVANAADRYGGYNILVVEGFLGEPDICDLWLCESTRLVLRTGLQYRFNVHPTCEKCAEIDKQSGFDQSEKHGHPET